MLTEQLFSPSCFPLETMSTGQPTSYQQFTQIVLREQHISNPDQNPWNDKFYWDIASLPLPKLTGSSLPQTNRVQYSLSLPDRSLFFKDQEGFPSDPIDQIAVLADLAERLSYHRHPDYISYASSRISHPSLPFRDFEIRHDHSSFERPYLRYIKCHALPPSVAVAIVYLVTKEVFPHLDLVLDTSVTRDQEGFDTAVSILRPSKYPGNLYAIVGDNRLDHSTLQTPFDQPYSEWAYPAQVRLSQHEPIIATPQDLLNSQAVFAEVPDQHLIEPIFKIKSTKIGRLLELQLPGTEIQIGLHMLDMLKILSQAIILPHIEPGPSNVRQVVLKIPVRDKLFALQISESMFKHLAQVLLDTKPFTQQHSNYFEPPSADIAFEQDQSLELWINTLKRYNGLIAKTYTKEQLQILQPLFHETSLSKSIQPLMLVYPLGLMPVATESIASSLEISPDLLPDWLLNALTMTTILPYTLKHTGENETEQLQASDRPNNIMFQIITNVNESHIRQPGKEAVPQLAIKTYSCELTEKTRTLPNVRSLTYYETSKTETESQPLKLEEILFMLSTLIELGQGYYCAMKGFPTPNTTNVLVFNKQTINQIINTINIHPDIRRALAHLPNTNTSRLQQLKSNLSAILGHSDTRFERTHSLRGIRQLALQARQYLYPDKHTSSKLRFAQKRYTQLLLE